MTDVTANDIDMSDADAFAALYEAHAGRVYALSLRMTGSAQDADECTQDAFVRVWQALPGFRGDSDVGTWIHRIAVNVVLAHFRSTQRREARMRVARELPLAVHAAPAAPPHLRIDIDRAIAALPSLERAVFVLREVEGYSYAEIAGMTGIVSATLRSHLYRARARLIATLDEAHDDVQRDRRACTDDE